MRACRTEDRTPPTFLRRRTRSGPSSPPTSPCWSAKTRPSAPTTCARSSTPCVRWIVRAGARPLLADALHHDFPPWEAVYQQTQRWLAAGVFEAMAHDLRGLLRLASGREPDPTSRIPRRRSSTAARCAPPPRAVRAGATTGPKTQEGLQGPRGGGHPGSCPQSLQHLSGASAMSLHPPYQVVH
jgi:transposase